MKYIVITAALFILTSCGAKQDSTAIAADLNKSKFEQPMQDDALFCTEAIAACLQEIRLSELVASHGSSPVVRKFAESMQQHHGAMNEELKSLAREKSIVVPAAPDEETSGIYTVLDKKTGAEFDKVYMDQMVKDHEKTVMKFRKQVEKGNDLKIKSWTALQLPKLEDHLQKAKDIRMNLKG